MGADARHRWSRATDRSKHGTTRNAVTAAHSAAPMVPEGIAGDRRRADPSPTTQGERSEALDANAAVREAAAGVLAPASPLAGERDGRSPVPSLYGWRNAAASGRVLEMVAHELRNPLAGVNGILELLREGLESGGTGAGPEALDLVETAQGEIQRITGILAGVVEAERTGSLLFAARREACDLREIVQAALRPMLRGTHPIILESEDPGPLRLAADRARLEQVFRNLLGNAAKYSPPGTLIRISVRRTERGMRVSVRDHGFGVPVDERERIFDRFYRASNLPGRDPGGAGLGLYLCRQIVMAHGGRIWVDAHAAGPGATFHVELPSAGA